MLPMSLYSTYVDCGYLYLILNAVAWCHYFHQNAYYYRIKRRLLYIVDDVVHLYYFIQNVNRSMNRTDNKKKV